VAGAYHSRLMESAYQKLSEALLEIEMQPPAFPIFTNVTGEAVCTLPEIRRTLRDQVTGTVRWADCMQGMAERGCDFFIELGPGGVLAGLLKRTVQDVEATSVGDVESARKGAARLRELHL
jgi:[acyl-carrier-protein] S-malonyltransferase